MRKMEEIYKVFLVRFRNLTIWGFSIFEERGGLFGSFPYDWVVLTICPHFSLFN